MRSREPTFLVQYIYIYDIIYHYVHGIIVNDMKKRKRYGPYDRRQPVCITNSKTTSYYN